MLVSHCPRCSESVRIPERLVSGALGGGDITIVCPWCSATLDGNEILSKMPPALVMVGADGVELSDEGYESPDRSAFDTQPTWSPGAADGAFGVTESRGLRNRPMPVGPPGPSDVMFDLNAAKTRQKAPSSLRTIVGIVFGAFLACGFVTGTMILAGKPLPKLGFYPYDGTFDPPPPTRSAAVLSGDPIRRPATSTPPVGRSLAEDLPPSEPTIDPAAQALAEITGGEEMGEPESSQPSSLFEDANRRPRIVLAEIPKEVEKKPVDTTPDFSAVGIPMDMTLNTLDQATLAVDETPKIVLPSVDDVRDALMSLPPAGDSKRSELLEAGYRDLAILASADDPSILIDLQVLLDELKTDQTLFRDLATYAPRWIDLESAQRATEGVIVFGKFLGTGPESRFILAGGKPVTAKLPPTVFLAPLGVQIGIGTIESENDKRRIVLKSLQSLN